MSLPLLSDIRDQASGLDRDQRNAFFAALLGWMMDAFDYFLLIFVITEVAKDFGTSAEKVTVATTLTLIARPLGAYLFGIWADKVGRRLPLMVDVLFYSAVEFVSGFSTSLTMLLALRFLYGLGMGGEWGLGAPLAMEKIPVEKRGFYSGLLQTGYSMGYLVAAVAYFVITPLFGWRGLFMFGAAPGLIALYIRYRVGESEVWARTSERLLITRTPLRKVFFDRKVLSRFFSLALLKTAFNFMSHGTQDVYPTFLKKGLEHSPHYAVGIAVVYNIGAVLGGIVLGAASQRLGRRRARLSRADRPRPETSRSDRTGRPVRRRRALRAAWPFAYFSGCGNNRSNREHVESAGRRGERCMRCGLERRTPWGPAGTARARTSRSSRRWRSASSCACSTTAAVRRGSTCRRWTASSGSAL